MKNSMFSSVDEYIATLAPDQQAELKRVQGLIAQVVPGAVQGVSYAMPAYLYQGKGLLSCMVNKHFLSIYPFSGKVIDSLKDKLKGYELTTGSIHFSLEHPLSESLIREILLTRMREIENKK